MLSHVPLCVVKEPKAGRCHDQREIRQVIGIADRVTLRDHASVRNAQHGDPVQAEVLNRCGHWVMSEYPERFNRSCLEFLGS